MGRRARADQAEQLEALVHAPAPTDFASDIWCILPEKRHRGGFYELFALLLVDFHVRFVLNTASYMQANQVVKQSLDCLTHRLASIRAEKRLKHSSSTLKLGATRRSKASPTIVTRPSSGCTLGRIWIGTSARAILRTSTRC